MNSSMRVLFMGTSDFAVPSLKALHSSGFSIPLVVTQPDRPAGRGLELKASPVKKAALELGLEVFQPEKARDPAAVERFLQADPDVAVVAAYGQILPSPVLKIPKTACLNIHGSILPKYRGAAPIHYAVIAGEERTGVTVIYMNEKMDEGDILLTEEIPVGPEETTGEVHDRLAKSGAQAIEKALRLLKEGRAPRTPQDPAQATYAPSIKREFCRLDWKAPAQRIFDRVRGLSPWPCAETGWKGMELKIHKAAMDQGKGDPGEILGISKEGVLVATGIGAVRLLEIQPPGKRKMSAYDFTLGHPDLRVGERFL